MLPVLHKRAEPCYILITWYASVVEILFRDYDYFEGLGTGYQAAGYSPACGHTAVEYFSQLSLGYSHSPY